MSDDWMDQVNQDSMRALDELRAEAGIPEPKCVECWCAGTDTTASEFRVFRWLCADHAAPYHLT